MLPLECKSQENKIIHLYVFISAQRNTGKIHKKFNSEFTYTGYRRGVVKAEWEYINVYLSFFIILNFDLYETLPFKTTTKKPLIFKVHN